MRNLIKIRHRRVGRAFTTGGEIGELEEWGRPVRYNLLRSSEPLFLSFGERVERKTLLMKGGDNGQDIMAEDACATGRRRSSKMR